MIFDVFKDILASGDPLGGGWRLFLTTEDQVGTQNSDFSGRETDFGRQEIDFGAQNGKFANPGSSKGEPGGMRVALSEARIHRIHWNTVINRRNSIRRASLQDAADLIASRRPPGLCDWEVGSGKWEVGSGKPKRLQKQTAKTEPSPNPIADLPGKNQ